MSAELNEKKLHDGLVAALCEDPGSLEDGLDLFDSLIPTPLGEEIDLIAVDKITRLTMIWVHPDKIAPQMALKTSLNIYYLWNFIGEFRADFFAEAEARDIALALRPPRIIVVADDIPAKFWSFLKWLKDRHIDVAVHGFEKQGNGSTAWRWPKTAWPDEIQPMTRSVRHRFDLENAKRVEREYIIWQRLTNGYPNLCGYDRNKNLAKARQQVLGE